MRTTLFYIPTEIAGLPVLGFGLLLAVWALICAVRVGWIVSQRGRSAEVWNELPMMAVLAGVLTFVLPALAEPDGLPIRGYGVMVFLGVMSGVGLAVYRAKREGCNPELIYSLALWMCVCAILGARLFYVIEYWQTHFHKPTLGATLAAIVNYTKGGLVVYGAFVGGAAAAVVFFVRHKLPVLKFSDIIAPSLLIGLALGRVGCFLNGCCYGGQCNLPWAVTFPPGSPPYMDQASNGQIAPYGIHFEAGGFSAAVVKSVDVNSPAAQAGVRSDDQLFSIVVLPPGAKEPIEFVAEDATKSSARPLSVTTAEGALAGAYKDGTLFTLHALDAAGKQVTRVWTLTPTTLVPARSLPVHPTQLYSAIDALLIALFLLAWYPFRRHDGELVALMLTIYPIMRFLEETIRTDESPVFGTGMSISQNVSILMLAAAVALWIYVLRGPRLRYDSPLHGSRGKIATV
jgi:phosphatidylglycerol:prolipoprotein diacylglycerol transferase